MPIPRTSTPSERTDIESVRAHSGARTLQYVERTGSRERKGLQRESLPFVRTKYPNVLRTTYDVPLGERKLALLLPLRWPILEPPETQFVAQRKEIVPTNALPTKVVQRLGDIGIRS